MKKMRRILALVLSLVMIAGLGLTAQAAEAPNEELINAVQAQVEAGETVTFTNVAELSYVLSRSLREERIPGRDRTETLHRVEVRAIKDPAVQNG
ncbi:MAG: hypothetical protein II529_03590 [Erysipelotrichaceae bacterium]|nr:hypothetical protein [Erysipelotrichaceae bacterium]